MSELNALGQEVFDQTPVSYPLHFDRPTPLHIRIRNMILQASQEVSSSQEFESIEEANDFNMPDMEDDWNSPYYEEEEYINPALESNNQSQDDSSRNVSQDSQESKKGSEESTGD